MPQSFVGQSHQTVAKLSVMSDGEVITVGSDGYTITSSLSERTAFFQPVHSGTGVWSMTLRDPAPKVIHVDVKTMLASTHYLSTQLLPTTTDSLGRLVLNFVFNAAGTPTDLPSGGMFNVFVEYGETK